MSRENGEIYHLGHKFSWHISFRNFKNAFVLCLVQKSFTEKESQHPDLPYENGVRHSLLCPFCHNSASIYLMPKLVMMA